MNEDLKARRRAAYGPNKRFPGGQRGNANALKTGCHTAEIRTLRSEVWAARRESRALIKQVRYQFGLGRGRPMAPAAKPEGVGNRKISKTNIANFAMESKEAVK